MTRTTLLAAMVATTTWISAGCGASSLGLAREGRFGEAATVARRESFEPRAAATLVETYALLDAATARRTSLTLAAQRIEEPALARSLGASSPDGRAVFYRFELRVEALPEGPRVYFQALIQDRDELPFGMEDVAAWAAAWVPRPSPPSESPRPGFEPRARVTDRLGGSSPCAPLETLLLGRRCSPTPRETERERRQRLARFDEEETTRRAEVEAAQADWEAARARAAQEHVDALQSHEYRLAEVRRALTGGCTDASGRERPLLDGSPDMRIQLEDGLVCTWITRAPGDSEHLSVRVRYLWPGEGSWTYAARVRPRLLRSGAPATAAALTETDAIGLTQLDTLSIEQRFATPD